MTDWIAAKQRIETFLADEAVLELLTMLDQKYIGEMKTAKTNEDRWRAQARSNAMDEFINALKIGQDRGEKDAIEKQRAEDKEDKLRTVSLL